ncbi:unnamed protein product [Nesidiocoris tenuis]|uniref:Uncharacterized protein n=1 Tax=Nesidiocoris tenuis TaxID=355587 RepID=A0A6H5FVD7_9HEMI|nr:unnamed protein product [Nesidiocoris tenuis]
MPRHHPCCSTCLCIRLGVVERRCAHNGSWTVGGAELMGRNKGVPIGALQLHISTPGGLLKLKEMKKLWHALFHESKDAHTPKEDERPVSGFFELPRLLEDDIKEKDKDRLRISGKLCNGDIFDFPSREEVKKKIEDAHKMYGIPQKKPKGAGDQEAIVPQWYYILDRPLVEQYVLMNNYIRKLSVLSSLKNPDFDNAIEEETASDASSSDYSDFSGNSVLLEKHKKSKKLRDEESMLRKNHQTPGTSADDDKAGQILHSIPIF